MGLRDVAGVGFRLGCPDFSGGELVDEVLVEQSEGLGKRSGADVVLDDLDAFEERLVEEASFGGRRVEVGGLDVAGELEGRIESALDLLVADVHLVQRAFSGGTFGLDLSELPLVSALGDLLGVVALHELVFAVIESVERFGSERDFALRDLDQAVAVCVESLPNPLALRFAQLHIGVVADDLVLDQLSRPVALLAGAELAAAADEVVECAAVPPSVAGEHQSATALAAVERALEVMGMFAVSFTGASSGRKLLLDALEER